MQSLEAELAQARALDVAALADAIESIGFECTRCGACCRAIECDDGTGDDDGGATSDGDPTPTEHTATVFPDEIRRLQETDDYDFRDVARPMPYGLTGGADGPEGETFEWSLQTDDCGDCTFYEEDDDGTGACSVHADRPLICQTYPFSVALGGTSQPMGETVDSVALPTRRDGGDAGDEAGAVRAHECEGLGRDISRDDAEALAATLKQRAVRELEEAIAVRDSYEPADPGPGEIVVHDSEGAKRPDGSPRE